ncbi:phospholipid phosphatase 3-like isoform X2 [Neocloeon triangulifer]|uniref:phospholipid phosphatase 3-like isoform X2 n=1 Tax=Neocloeon triangulifer TaxID=2078957 RepID=UPI00286F46C7|nr:phospholipid phosphatase 3-like isoform X2 [Neocloeon triangulifer]
MNKIIISQYFSTTIFVALNCKVVLILIVIETGWLPGAKSGFYCDDKTIAHKFTGDTISLNLLLGVSFVAPLLFLYSIESSCCHCSGSDEGSWLMKAWRHTWVWYREYMLGLGMIILATELAKIMVSEPRPHFLHTCAPDAMVNGVEHCKSLAPATQGYIEEFNCTNKDISDYRLRDSVKSFPSGHASVSVFTAMFLICFLQRRMTGVPRNSPSQYLKPWLQCVCLTWALLCALSRINDHRHHPHDVIAGSIFGAIFGLVTARYFCGGFWPGQCAIRLNQDPPSEGNSSGGTAVTTLEERNGLKHHPSVRRLLSSTSSYTGSIGTDELREVR